MPYITEIETPKRSLGGLKNNNIRSANGNYSIMYAEDENADTYSSEFINVKGFNLNPGENDVRVVKTAKKDSNALTTNDTDGIKVSHSTPASPYTMFKASNVISKSGYLEVFTNGVRSLNNINNNDAYGTTQNSSNVQITVANATITDYANAYNREADYNKTKNVQLTDDRYLIIWDMKDTGVKNGYYPVMTMIGSDGTRGNNPVFGYLQKTGGTEESGAGPNYPQYAMPQRAEFNGTTGSNEYTEYLIKAPMWDQMGMAVDQGGRYYNVSVYDRDDCAMHLIYDRYAEIQKYNYKTGYGFATGVSLGSNWNYAHGRNNNAIVLESVNYSELQIGRYQYPKLIAKGNSKNNDTPAYIYMSYYDEGTGQIIFRNFQIGKKVTNGTSTTLSSSNGYALDSSNSDNSNLQYAQRINFKENRYDDNLSATDSARPSKTWDAGRLIAIDKSDTSKPSKYFDMAVTSDNRVIIVYYDELSSKLKLAYTGTNVKGEKPSDLNYAKFTISNVDFPEYVGTYVSLAVDSNNHIHISGFDANDSDLYYIYLDSYSSSSIDDKQIIDQFGSVGHWTQVRINTTHTNSPYYNKPVIAYYNSTETGGREAIKLAIAQNTVGQTEAGVDSNGYTTGKWEYMTVPSITPPQGGDPKFQNVCLDFDSSGNPVVGYLGSNLEFGKQRSE